MVCAVTGQAGATYPTMPSRQYGRVSPFRSTLRFEVTPLDDARLHIKQVIPFIDERSLVEIVAEFETAQGIHHGSGYGGLVPEFYGFRRLDRYFLGEQEPWTDGRPLAVLACKCGEAGCWPLDAMVIVTAGEVTWARFSQPHRPEWDYSGLGSFTFAREQYEAAAQDGTAALGGTR